MSEQAKQLIGEKLENYGEMPFAELVEELHKDLGVQEKTCKTYVYQYAESEDRDEGKTVVGMKPDHMDAMVDAGYEVEEGEFGPDDEIPPETGQQFHGLAIRQPGHPEVPETDEFVKRPMGGDHMDIDFNKNANLIEVMADAFNDADFGVMLIGEPGVGKSYTVKHLCSETNTPWTRVNFGSRVTKEKLVGGFVPKGNGDESEKILNKARDMADEHEDITVSDALNLLGQRENFKWVDGLLTKRVRNGGVFQGDELNAATAEALMPLHGLLEDAANRSLELLEKGEVVEPHPDFTFVGTMNPPSFRGTNELNEAFKSRMIPIPVPRLEERAEKGLLREVTDLSKDEADSLVGLSRDISSAENGPTFTFREMKKIASMRNSLGLKGATMMVMMGIASNEAQKNAAKKRIEKQNW